MPRTLISVIALSAILAACSSATKKPEEAPAAMSTPAAKAIDAEAQQQQKLAERLGSKSVYFDYNKFTIKSKYQTLLQQDASVITAAPKALIRVEGKADARGSAEYNLALGQKRAEAVKRALKLQGVPESQLEAISYGSEKPRASCQEEKCWEENRRVDLTLKK